MCSVQMEGSPTQIQPVSIWQLALQPSPGTVPPSSHSSVPPIPPSPQTLHTEGSPVQVHPDSTWQPGSQPSPGVVPPSSHC